MTTFDDHRSRSAIGSSRTGRSRPADWRGRVRRWWERLGWDPHTLPETLRADVEPDHVRARPVRGRAEWERGL
ncbi:hypothetical protein [Aureimonas jatrophae]|uniref:Uncharacterized protein n=1 Tax=Aureimonas jatrophae TaxID=1166073 RepID=A0A1H0EJW5_9HYPH|nr:hypothetical protein [Aureimonas jatrophae]MBB3950460.1 hypothetical protein [Aureimonas jatrophae]SDN82698.1 hypothetical protein SAMN05192530_10276 [Aureimonas jatrophae]